MKNGIRLRIIGQKGKKRRRRTSPVPVSMWLLPPFRLPFANPREFLLWFLAGVNLWAMGAGLFCALGGYFLLGWLGQRRRTGVEQALAGGEGTRGLSYRVEQVGDGEAAVTGTWDPEKEEWVYILDEDTPLANMDATPPTGDPSLTGLWALLNGLSLTGVAAVLTGFRRKKKDD